MWGLSQQKDGIEAEWPLFRSLCGVGLELSYRHQGLLQG